uniref:DUF4939 domain-containing protein n=1 Tax=Cyprinus carpio carpio TaxID=630221 RepID=A0A9J8BDS3_CYPCA
MVFIINVCLLRRRRQMDTLEYQLPFYICWLWSVPVAFPWNCELIFEMQPSRYPTDQSKIAFIISLLTGKALRWTVSIWHQNGPFLHSYRGFSEYFQEVLGIPEGYHPQINGQTERKIQEVGRFH